MKTKYLILQLAALILVMGSAGAQTVNVFATTSSALLGSTYTAAELGGFDPTGASKLVVTISDEGARPSAVTYAGESLTRAVATSGRTADIWYLDYDGITATQGDLVLNAGGSSQGVSLIAMSNTAKGFLATSSSGGASTSLDPGYNGSAVVAAFVANGGGTATANAPLTTVLSASDIGSAYGASGVGIVNAGSQSFSFSNTGSPDSTTAVAFVATGADGDAPGIASTSPADEATGVLTDPTITVNFDESIFVGSGSILLKEDGGATVATFDVTASSDIDFGLTSLTVASPVLEPDTSYFLQIPNGAIEDGSGNTTSYADTTLNFTTGPWLTLARRPSGNPGTFTTTDLGGFDPTGYDKIVLIVMDEGSGASSASWGTSGMTNIVNASNSGRLTNLYYLDGPFSGPDSLTISGSLNTYGFSLLALAGTEVGAGTFDSGGTSSISFTTATDDSFVVAAYTVNGDGPPSANSPLTGYYSQSVGSAAGASGVAVNTTAGAQTFSFSGTSAGALAIVEFPKAGADDVPPGVAATDPIDGSTGLLTDLTLQVSFDEPITVGSGSILLKEDGGATVASYDVNSAPEIVFGLNDFTITPDVLDPSTSYFLQIPSGAIEDSVGNTTAYADTTLTFTTGQFLTLRTSGSGTFTTTDLRGFDASGYDKVVVSLMDETGGGFPTVDFGDTSMMLVASEVGTNNIERAAMYYVDGPFTGSESLVISDGGWGVGILALSGTVPGLAGFDTDKSNSLAYTTATADAFVVATYATNGGGNPVAATSPSGIITYFSANVGSGDGASSVFATTAAGVEETYTFNFPSTPALIVAEFATTSTGGGGGDPFADWATANGLTGGNNGFADNPSGSPFDNGLLWILGSTTPLGYNSYDSLVTATGDGTTGLTFVFNRVDASIGEAGISIGYSTDAFENDINTVGPIPTSGTNVDIGNGVLATIVDNGATDTITVVIPASLGNPGGSLYGRLLATEL